MSRNGDYLIWPKKVSILVFVELALDAVSYHFCRSGMSLVSILVFVELALDEPFMVRLFIEDEVSILVFVELALDVLSSRPSQPRAQVSILVFVELALDVAAKNSEWVTTKFQSLFSWNLLLMSGKNPRCDGYY